MMRVVLFFCSCGPLITAMAHQTLPDKETQGGLSIKQLREKIGFYKYQNNDTALIYALELTRQNEGTSDLREKLENVGLIARVYMHLEYYDLALQLYNDIFTEIEESGDKEMLAESMHYLAVVDAPLNCQLSVRSQQ